MAWTNKQLEAINYENKENILVSAGAGSGKTAILSERVIRKLKDGININELLILTFTKAASEEMKDRIRSKIIDNHLYEQLDLLDSSYITTFDSYALSIVRKYHYLLGLDRDISLVDESILKIERERIIEEVLERYYLNKEEDFIKLVHTLLRKSDDSLKSGIESIIDKVELEIDSLDYLEKLEQLEINACFNDIYNSYINRLLSIIEKIGNSLIAMESLVENEKDEEYVSKCNNYYSSLISAKTYNEIKRGLELERLNLPKNVNEDISSIKKEITRLVNELKDLVIYENEEFIKDAYKESGLLSKTLLRIVKEVYLSYSDYKRANKLFSFMDIAKLAIKIFKENPSICEEIKNSLKEIMIDEYQDTSSMQEIFTSYICDNNLYLVGDIKQSIYRFRYANPKLFKDKYEHYKQHDGGHLIDLNTNFRSRKEVLNNINEIFSIIMNDDIGGANYKKDHLIEYGNTDYLNDEISNEDHNLVIYNYNRDDFKGLNANEIEAFIVANDIKNKLDNHYLIYDKNNHNREVTYKDFTILIDKRSSFTTYKKIFEYFNLPVNLYQNENLVGHDDLNIFHSILILINGYAHNNYDNTFRHAYYSLAKSYLFAFEDQQVLDTLLNNDFKNSPIYNKLESTINNLDALSLKDLFRKIIFDLEWYNLLIFKGDTKETEAKLSYLLSVASNLDRLDYSLDKVIEYFKILKEKELEIVLPSSNNNVDAIKFMTIHNSKGLQFPICYFIGFNNKFNVEEIKDSFILTDQGIILPFIDNNIRYPNIAWFKYKQDFLNEEVSEKIRLFYVSLTRAQEKLIMITDLNDKDEIKSLDQANCFKDFILAAKNELSHYLDSVDVNKLKVNYQYQSYYPNKYLKNDFRNFEYINITNNKEVKVSKKASKDLELKDNDSTVLDIGNYYHNLLFILDFKDPKLDNLSKRETDIISHFLQMDFLDLKNALNIYKEVEYVNDNEHGFMDLVIEYPDEYKIIDYKLNNLEDDNYQVQLRAYKNYLQKIVNKPIKLYLYSLFKGFYKEVE